MWRRTAPARRDATAPVAASPVPRALLRGAVVAALLALPILAWLARMRGLVALANVVALVLVVATLAVLTRGLGVRVAGALAAAVAALAAGAVAAGLAPVYWPPVAINLALAAAFGVSLHRGEPLILRFARMEGAAPTPSIERYCRRLTVVWTVYLTLLAVAGIAIALHGDERIGAWWSGALDYLLIAALFVGERVYRRLAGGSPVGLLEQARNVRRALRSPRA